METTNKKINDLWDESRMKKPPILYALDSNDKLFIVAREKNSIVTLVVQYGKKIYTYVIPKVYLSTCDGVNHDYYRVKNASKLSIISCSNSQIDEMANFVAANIINKI